MQVLHAKFQKFPRGITPDPHSRRGDPLCTSPATALGRARGRYAPPRLHSPKFEPPKQNPTYGACINIQQYT
jgi:hypothetical protein